MDPLNLAQVHGAIRQALSQGKSLEEIRDFMRSTGYSNLEIGEAFSTMPEATAQTEAPSAQSTPVDAQSIPIGAQSAPVIQAQEAPQPLQKERFCTKCGDKIDEGELFCTKCGTRLQESSPVVTRSPTAILNKKRGTFRRKKVVLASLVIAILVIASVSVYFLVGNQVKTNSADSGPAVFGWVHDSSDRVIPSADVYSGTVSTKTDANGEYELQMPNFERNVLTFESEGYVPVHKIVPMNLTGRMSLNVLMAEMAPFENVSQTGYSGKAGNDEVSISFSKQSFVVKGTNSTTDEVSVSLTYFDPTNEDDISVFPGEFEAMQDGESVPLESFGFAKLMVQDASGRSMDLAPGKNATLKMKISGDGASAPDTMPLWYFDDNAGYWVYKTVAKKTGSSYSGYYYEGKIDTVASWWNCDMTFERSWFDLIFDDFLFNKDFTNSNWRLLWDVAGLVYEPIDWAQNVWILLNPNTNKFEKGLAVVAFLPFVSQSMLRAGVRGYLDEVFTSVPSQKRFFERMLNMGEVVENAANNRVYGKAILQPTWRSGVFDAHLLPTRNIRDYVASKNALIDAFSNSDEGIRVIGRTASEGAQNFFKKVANSLDIPVTSRAYTPSSFDVISYNRGASYGFYPPAGRWAEYVLDTGASGRVTLSSVAQKLTYTAEKVGTTALYELAVVGKTLYHIPKADSAQGATGSDTAPSTEAATPFEYKTSFVHDGAQYLVNSLDMAAYDDLEISVDEVTYRFQNGLLGQLLYPDGSSISYGYDENDYVVHETGPDYETDYEYSDNYNTVRKTTVSGDNTYDALLEIDVPAKSFTLKDLGTGEYTTVTAGSDMVPESIIMSGEKETVTYSFGANGSNMGISSVSGGPTVNTTMHYDQNSGTMETIFDISGDEGLFRIVALESLGPDGVVKSGNYDYYEDTSTGYLPLFTETLTYNYAQYPESSLSGTPMPANLTRVLTDHVNDLEVLSMVDLSTLPEGYPALPENSEFGNEHAKIKTGTAGNIIELWLSREAMAYIGLPNAPEWALFRYDETGRAKNMELPGGYLVEFDYGITGEPSIIVPGNATTGDSPEALGAFLSNFDLKDARFSAVIDGVDYNYVRTYTFDPSQDAKVSLVARNGSEAELSIKLGDAVLFTDTETAGEPGERREVVVGPTPIAGIRASISLDPQYSAPVSGFLVFETDGHIASYMPISLKPGQANTISMPIPSGKAGSAYFKTFDFMTSGVPVGPVDRLTMANVALSVPKDCSNQRSVIIVADISYSMDDMSESDDTVSKLDLEKRVITDLIKSFGDNTKYGLIKFSSSVYLAGFNADLEPVWENLYNKDIADYIGKKIFFTREDNDKVIQSVVGLDSGSGTDIELGVMKALEVLKYVSSPVKRIVLLTDGASDVDFEKVSEALPSDVMISTIGIFGEEKTETTYDPGVLENMSTIGGGEFYQVSDYAQFYSALEASAKGC